VTFLVDAIVSALDAADFVELSRTMLASGPPRTVSNA
jgi:hypothetical protein